jgi:hypothetical protein
MKACRWKPKPDQPVVPVAGCPECGHLVLLHAGVDVCPLCVLVNVASQVRDHEARLAKVERDDGIKLL